MKKLLTVLGSIAVGLTIIVGLMYWNANTTEKTLRAKVEAQQKVCMAFYDELWKIISQKAGVSEQYAKTFKDIYPALIEGRYGNEKGGTLMKWVQESNPTFDVSLYKDLMNSIEAERKGFTMEQDKLIDIALQHHLMLTVPPSSWFVGSRPEVQYTLITSNKTKEVYRTGEENDVELFDRK